MADTYNQNLHGVSSPVLLAGRVSAEHIGQTQVGQFSSATISNFPLARHWMGTLFFVGLSGYINNIRFH